MKTKKSVIFICYHNSARSQMAEGFLRNIYGEFYQSYSAGTDIHKVNPLAVKVMAEIGIDISTHRSKSLKEFLNRDIDIVVTVCEQKEKCPLSLEGKKYIHKKFEDPSKFQGTANEKILYFRN
ncbi:MAG: arsenate reductase ArsC [Methanomicrobiales archaeon]